MMIFNFWGKIAVECKVLTFNGCRDVQTVKGQLNKGHEDILVLVDKEKSGNSLKDREKKKELLSLWLLLSVDIEC